MGTAVLSLPSATFSFLALVHHRELSRSLLVGPLSLGYTGLLSFARQEFDPWTPLQTSSTCLLGIGPSGDVPQSYELLPTLPLLCRFALWVDSRLHPCAELHVNVFVYYLLLLVVFALVGFRLLFVFRQLIVFL